MDSIPSVEELLTEFISAGQDEVECSFRRGRVAGHLLQMGYTFNTLSQEVKCSPEKIRVLVRTYEAFPKPEDRHYAEMDFYHYRLAARTDNPHHWMEQASINEWSTREMVQALKGNVIEEDKREAERLLFKVKAMLDDESHGVWFCNELIKLLSKKDQLSELLVKTA